MHSIVIAILQSSLMASGMILLFWGLTRLCARRLRATTACLLWALVLLRLLLPVSIPSPIALLPADAPNLPIYIPAQVQAQAPPQAELQPLPAAANPVQINAANPAPATESNATPTVQRPAPSIDLWQIAIWLWAAGAASILLLHGIKTLRFARKLRRCAPVTDAALLQDAKYPVLACDVVVAPAVFGCFRPKILIPPVFLESMEPAELRTILCHETEHIRHRDLWTKQLWLLARALHWFNPLVWIACRLHERRVEARCDAAVVRRLQGEGAYAYSNALLRAARIMQSHTNPSPVRSLLPKGSQLKERIATIMHPKKKSAAILLLTIIISLCAIFLFFTTACLSKRAAEEPPEPPVTEPTPAPEERTEQDEDIARIKHILGDDAIVYAHVIGLTDGSVTIAMIPGDSYYFASDGEQIFTYLAALPDYASIAYRYGDENTCISIRKEAAYGASYYVANIVIADPGALRTAFANDAFGARNKDFAENIAQNVGAILAISGDFSSARQEGIVLRNGVLYRDSAAGDVCVFYADGVMETYTKDAFDIDAALARGAQQIWSCGPALLAGGQPIASFGKDDKLAGPRSAIGYYGPGHYCFVTVEDDMTLAELSQLFYSLGCTVAYNLNGATAALIFEGERINNPTQGNRQIGDIIYIGG
ncbi:MAG: phosphodiester glycosidase family protein [Clostridiales bacterium]|nr:phosphodiester glycosidase family protein [Clostridiales bacterium]